MCEDNVALCKQAPDDAVKPEVQHQASILAGCMFPGNCHCVKGQTCSLGLVDTPEGTGQRSLNSCDPRGTSSSGGRCPSTQWQGRRSHACGGSHRLL